jgi:hypothetical protein
MYTSGHIEILEDALRLLNSRSQLLLPYADDDDSFKKSLMEGLMYPDFPCGKIEVVKTMKNNNNKQNIRDGLVAKMESCGLPRLLMSMIFDRMSLGYQSHKGFYSLWHSMTYDPDKTVENVAKNVGEYVLVCCKQAFELANPFWLGFALHIVMDAYSPAHVLRENTYEGVDYAHLATWIGLHDSELPAADKESILELRNMITGIVAAVDHLESQNSSNSSNSNSSNSSKTTSTAAAAEDIINRYPSRLRSAAAYILYEHLQRRDMLRKYGIVDVTTATTRKRKRNLMTAYPIMNFYYYPHQGRVFHALYDRIAQVRKLQLYSECVRDTARMIEVYVRATNSIKTTTNNYSQIRSKVIKVIKTSLQEVQVLLATRTLAVHPRCAPADTGFDIIRVLSPSYRTLTFLPQKSSSDYYRNKSADRIYYYNLFSNNTNNNYNNDDDDDDDDNKKMKRRSMAKQDNVLYVRWWSPNVFELPVVRNHLTNPVVSYIKFSTSTSSPHDRRIVNRTFSNKNVASIMYTVLKVSEGCTTGFPVRLVIECTEGNVTVLTINKELLLLL